MVKLGSLPHNIKSWNEALHPRDSKGRFTFKGLGTGAKDPIFGSRKRKGAPPGERTNPASSYTPTHIKEAKKPSKRLKDLGLTTIGIEPLDKENPHLGHLLADALERARGMGATLPKYFLLDPQGKNQDHVASYAPQLDALIINDEAPYWSDPWNQAAGEYETGFWSSPDPLSPVYHELGHGEHRKRVGLDDYSVLRAADPVSDIIGYKEEGTYDPKGFDKAQDIAKEVSDYGMTNGVEFVAEVYAGLLSGRKYSEDVMDLYQSYGGPQL